VIRQFVRPYFSVGWSALRVMNRTAGFLFRSLEQMTGTSALVQVSDRRVGRLLRRRGLSDDTDAADPLAAESLALAGLRAKSYESPSHHFHPPGSRGPLCVNCHMPAKDYMVIDARRDRPASRSPPPGLQSSRQSYGETLPWWRPGIEDDRVQLTPARASST
jgi:hypothetical protein